MYKSNSSNEIHEFWEVLPMRENKICTSCLAKRHTFFNIFLLTLLHYLTYFLLYLKYGEEGGKVGKHLYVPQE